MKTHEKASFFKEIKNQLSKVVLIAAPRPSQEEIIFELRSFFKGIKIPIKSIDSESFNLDSFSQDVETLPFLSQKVALFLLRIEQLDKRAIDRISSYVEKPNDWTLLVLAGEGLNASSKLYKVCEKKGLLFHFKEKKPWDLEKELIDWLRNVAAKEGATLGSEAAKALIDHLGSDRALLISEIQKLICYIGNRSEITLSDIAAISCRVHKETLFQLGSAVLSKDLRKALAIMKILLEEEIPIYSLIPSLRVCFQQNLEILSYYKQGGYPCVTASFPYLQGKFLEKKVQIAALFGEPALKKGLISITAMDLKSKNLKVSPQLLLERLLIQLCEL